MAASFGTTRSDAGCDKPTPQIASRPDLSTAGRTGTPTGVWVRLATYRLDAKQVWLEERWKLLLRPDFELIDPDVHLALLLASVTTRNARTLHPNSGGTMEMCAASHRLAGSRIRPGLAAVVVRERGGGHSAQTAHRSPRAFSCWGGTHAA